MSFKDSPRFFKSPFSSEFCEFFKCRDVRARAKWIVGQPNPSSLVMPGFLRVCEEDAKSIVSQLPPELLEYVPEVKALQEQVRDLTEQLQAAKASNEKLQQAQSPPANQDQSGVPCPYCGEPFPNSRAMGGHKGSCPKKPPKE